MEDCRLSAIPPIGNMGLARRFPMMEIHVSTSLDRPAILQAIKLLMSSLWLRTMLKCLSCGFYCWFPRLCVVSTPPLSVGSFVFSISSQSCQKKSYYVHNFFFKFCEYFLIKKKLFDQKSKNQSRDIYYIYYYEFDFLSIIF